MRIIQIASTTQWTIQSNPEGSSSGEGKPVLFALCENGRVAWVEPEGFRNNWRPLVEVPDGLFDAPIERRRKPRL